MNEILIKADELKSLITYLDEIPHKYSKEILGFLAKVSERREEEASQAKQESVEKPLKLRAEKKA